MLCRWQLQWINQWDRMHQWLPKGRWVGVAGWNSPTLKSEVQSKLCYNVIVPSPNTLWNKKIRQSENWYENNKCTVSLWQLDLKAIPNWPVKATVLIKCLITLPPKLGIGAGSYIISQRHSHAHMKQYNKKKMHAKRTGKN